MSCVVFKSVPVPTVYQTECEGWGEVTIATIGLGGGVNTPKTRRERAQHVQWAS